MRRPPIIAIVFVLSCSSAEPEGPVDNPEEDPACAGESPPPEEESARVDDELPWDLDRDVALPPCSPDAPDCDRIDEPDVPFDDIDLHGVSTDESGFATYGLADPLTSTGKYRTWPKGRIPYKLATTNGVVQINSATRTALSQAMTNWEQLTEGRIKFRPKQSTDTAYVLVKQGSPRVSPFVGYRAGQVQSLYLRDSEYITVIKHELGHVVGLHHEQRRTDRLDYIKVRSQYIVDTATCKYQFATCSDCKKVGTYDRNSVMHYRTTDLANCRTGAVLLKLDGSAINHYWKLSPKDLSTVAKMYATPTTQPPQPEPQPSPVLPESGSVIAGALCAGVADNSVADGAAIVGETCDGKGDQDWRTTADGQLRVQHSLQCAAVVGCSVVGAAIEQTTCSPTALDQKWTLSEMSLLHGATNKCATVAGGKLALAACDGSDAQLVDYRSDAETLAIGEQCITAGSAVTLAACDGSEAQRWFQARGGFVTRTNTGRCLRVDAAGALALADCTDAIDQRWALRGAIQDGRSALCVQTGAAGAPLSLALCDGSAAQTFTLWSR